MTREEHIFEYLKERNIPITSLEANSIIEGIEWADEHPDSKRTYTKQQLIEKACEWLKDWDRKTMYELSMIMGSKFIEDFKKAMEE